MIRMDYPIGQIRVNEGAFEKATQWLHEKPAEAWLQALREALEKQELDSQDNE